MSRKTWTLDRAVTVVIGLALVAVGALAVIWRLDVWTALPERSDTSQPSAMTVTDWWPWAVTAAGVVLAALGLRWLWAHLPARGVGELNLPGTGEKGRLRFNAKSAASSAAEAFSETPAVRKARGTVKRDRGQLVVDIKATIDPDADLGVLAEHADQTIADLAHVMGRTDLFGRVHLVVSSSQSSRIPRVT